MYAHPDRSVSGSFVGFQLLKKIMKSLKIVIRLLMVCCIWWHSYKQGKL